ncbi:hypothetical protein VZT92_021176 [Zoarces viviparus]|uniref:Uncharacterized protein n=1 Tax=Zoarces viviparus TaxID=48416 RepID=A0AAW1EF90_ZOAVI
MMTALDLEEEEEAQQVPVEEEHVVQDETDTACGNPDSIREKQKLKASNSHLQLELEKSLATSKQSAKRLRKQGQTPRPVAQQEAEGAMDSSGVANLQWEAF